MVGYENQEVESNDYPDDHGRAYRGLRKLAVPKTGSYFILICGLVVGWMSSCVLGAKQFQYYQVSVLS